MTQARARDSIISAEISLLEDIARFLGILEGGRLRGSQIRQVRPNHQLRRCLRLFSAAGAAYCRSLEGVRKI
jgi:hypothetical protein